MTPIPATSIIAQASFIWVRPDGSEITVTARLGMPYRVEHTTWACPVELDGMPPFRKDVLGEGSLQPITLALRTLRIKVEALLEPGGALYYPEDRTHPLDRTVLDAVFGSLPTP